MTVNELRVGLKISLDEFMLYYRGAAQNVIATAADGRRIQFPANILRPFLSEKGIEGIFLLRFDENNKLIDIHKVM